MEWLNSSMATTRTFSSNLFVLVWFNKSNKNYIVFNIIFDHLKVVFFCLTLNKILIYKLTIENGNKSKLHEEKVHEVT